MRAGGPVAAAKKALRARLIAGRAEFSPAGREAAGDAIRAVLLDTPEIAAAASVAAYVSIGAEPPTAPLLDALRERHVEVLLPVLRADNDLDWARYDGTLVSGRHGLLEPARERQGTEAIGTVDVVLVPALAVDRAGRRLGRGGGSYDRALARLAPAAWTVALLYDGELLDDVPAEKHDHPVDAAAAPAGIVRF
ncbi:MAG TPA: 5-formyltetrahydrofolate cyclo-ligase [Mycobacteriales bacterium]|nr:5-formyltetrahydrofolate cyclo-ligase [Mycobacteriales bacterium]